VLVAEFELLGDELVVPDMPHAARTVTASPPAAAAASRVRHSAWSLGSPWVCATV
jgi:hypothetical protein